MYDMNFTYVTLVKTFSHNIFLLIFSLTSVRKHVSSLILYPTFDREVSLHSAN